MTFLKKLLTVFYGYNLGAPDGGFVTRPTRGNFVLDQSALLFTILP